MSSSNRLRKDSTGHSEKSPSLFEELSIGASIDQVDLDGDPGLRRNRSRSITRLQGGANSSGVNANNANAFLHEHL